MLHTLRRADDTAYSIIHAIYACCCPGMESQTGYMQTQGVAQSLHDISRPSVMHALPYCGLVEVRQIVRMHELLPF